MAPVGVPRLSEIALDRRVFGVGLAATLAIGFSVGLVPALRLSRASGSGGFHSSGWNRVTGRSKMRRILVLAQVAMAVMLTIGAGLLGRSLRNLVAIDNGFAVDHLVSVELSLRGMTGMTGISGDARQLFRALTDSTESLPGVRSAAVSLQLPTQLAGLRTPVRIVGADSQATATLRPIDSKYLETIGVPITTGRSFARTDSQTAPAVAIVNAAFVRDILRGSPAIGVRLSMPLMKGQPSIIGVVADVTPAGEPDRAAVYVPIDQLPIGGGFLLLRTRDDPAAALSAVTIRVHEVAPNLAVDRTQRVAEVLERSRSIARFNTQLVAAFAALALLLSAVGIYGLTSGEVAARWRELAIRLALGASPRRALWTVVAPCAAVTMAGAALGVVGGLIAAPWLASLLHGVGPNDAVTIFTAPAILAAVGIFAAVLASARVLRAAPATTLRGE
jgi:predicted permease